MKDKINLESSKKILLEFAKVGSKKISMKEIAFHANISRQSIYKKFGTKDVCYDYVLHIYIEDLYKRIFEKLESKDINNKKVLFDVFNIFLGESIEIVNNPYGTKVLDDCLRYVHSSQDDWHLRFKLKLKNYLVKNNLIEEEKADSRALTLIVASKGLLLEKQNLKEFQHDLKIIINDLI